MLATTPVRPIVIPRTHWFEQAYVVLTFLFAAGGLNGIFLDGTTESLNDSNSMRLLIALALYLVAVAILIQRHWPSLVTLAVRNPVLLLLLIYILASCLWSDDVGATFRRAMAFVLTTLFCAYVVIEYDLRQILRLIAIATLIFAGISLFNLANDPVNLISDDARKFGAWTNGITGLTFFGRVMAISALVLWFVKKDVGPWRWIGWGGFLLACLMLVKIQAATATVAVTLTIGVIIFFDIVRAYRLSLGTFLAISAAIALPLMFMFMFGIDAFFEIIGRDPTLTNRTRIWDVATTFAMENHPWLGAGFRAFWTDVHSATVRFLIYGSRLTDYGNGHSGYIDVWLELGVPGVIGLALVLAGALASSFYLLLYHPDNRIVFLPAVMVFMLLYNFSEKVFLEHTDIASLTLMVVILKATWLCTLRADGIDRGMSYPPRPPYQLVPKVG